MGTRTELNSQVAQLVDNLFTRKRRLDGDEYSYAELAHASGGQFSGTYFAKLRRGEIKNPGRDGLLFL